MIKHVIYFLTEKVNGKCYYTLIVLLVFEVVIRYWFFTIILAVKLQLSGTEKLYNPLELSYVLGFYVTFLSYYLHIYIYTHKWFNFYFRKCYA